MTVLELLAALSSNAVSTDMEVGVSNAYVSFVEDLAGVCLKRYGDRCVVVLETGTTTIAGIDDEGGELAASEVVDLDR